MKAKCPNIRVMTNIYVCDVIGLYYDVISTSYCTKSANFDDKSYNFPTKMPELVYGPPVAHSNFLTVIHMTLMYIFQWKVLWARSGPYNFFSKTWLKISDFWQNLEFLPFYEFSRSQSKEMVTAIEKLILKCWNKDI